MSTTEQQPVAVQDLPDDEPMPIAVQFASRGRHLTLERVHPRKMLDGAGNASWTQPVVYEFMDGLLLVYPEQDVIADKFDPATGKFAEQDAIEWLRGHELYGLADRGFWEVAPVAPDPAGVMQTIMQLAVQAGHPDRRDAAEERLVALHEREINAWNRALVVNACRSALAAIESHAELSAEPTAQGQPWAGQGAQKDGPAPPPGFTRVDGVLQPDNPEAIPSGTGSKPQDLNRGFDPDHAPVREG